MKTKLWGTAVAFMLMATLGACNNESKRAKAGEAVEDAREELEETRANDGDANETRAKRADYDSAKADYEKMNDPSKRDTTDN